MGYSHGQQWTEEKIIDKIKYVMKKAEIDIMPTARIMKEVTGNCALSCAVSKRGGTLYYAEKLGLELGKCESTYGKQFEELCCQEIKEKFGYDCELMKTGYPYDILCNGIKIDVKVSKLIQTNDGRRYYTCNIEKKSPTCDFFICYCVDDEDNILREYIIPSVITKGHTQISMGEFNSKYDCFIDNWDCLKTYNDFFENIVNEFSQKIVLKKTKK